jgi:hypothetical protein
MIIFNLIECYGAKDFTLSELQVLKFISIYILAHPVTNLSISLFFCGQEGCSLIRALVFFLH